MNEFEEWMGHYDCCPTPEAYSAAKAAYQAGADAGYAKGVTTIRKIEVEWYG